MYDRLLICTIIIVSAVVYQVDAAMTMDQIQKTATAVRNTCVTKSNADPALVAGIQKGEFPDNEQLRCYALCIMKTMRTNANNITSMHRITIMFKYTWYMADCSQQYRQVMDIFNNVVTAFKFKNGNVDADSTIRQIELMMPADMVGPLKVVTQKCAAAPSAGNDCATALQYVKCSYETDPSHFFFP